VGQCCVNIKRAPRRISGILLCQPRSVVDLTRGDCMRELCSSWHFRLRQLSKMLKGKTPNGERDHYAFHPRTTLRMRLCDPLRRHTPSAKWHWEEIPMNPRMWARLIRSVSMGGTPVTYTLAHWLSHCARAHPRQDHRCNATRDAAREGVIHAHSACPSVSWKNGATFEGT
jgi:diadenosine tetraphosphatase ApaH/serine/threonine PP2A family protein phosphatase